MPLENLTNQTKESLSKKEQEWLLAFYVSLIAWIPIRDGLNKVYNNIRKMYSDFEKNYNKERYLNKAK